jgi:hypothetical protein
LDLSTLIWDDVTPTWQGTSVGGSTLQRQSFVIAQAIDESGFWVYGGLMGATVSGVILNDYLFYSYITGNWTTYGDVYNVTARWDAPFAVADGKLFVFGGAGTTNSPNDILQFDLTTQVWSVDPANTFNTSVAEGSATAIGNVIYVTSPAKGIYSYTITTTPSISSTAAPSYSTAIPNNSTIYTYWNNTGITQAPASSSSGTVVPSSTEGEIITYTLVDMNAWNLTRGYTSAMAISNTQIAYTFSSPSLGFSNSTFIYDIPSNSFRTILYPNAPSSRYAQTTCTHPSGSYSFVSSSTFILDINLIIL